MPVTVNTPFCVTDQTTFMTVVGKHKPKQWEGEGGCEGGGGGGGEGFLRAILGDCMLQTSVQCRRIKRTPATMAAPMKLMAQLMCLTPCS